MDILTSFVIPLLVVLVVGGLAYGASKLTMHWLDGQEKLVENQEEKK